MPNDKYSRELKTETLQVKTLQRLTELVLKNGRFRATYTDYENLPSGKEFATGTFTVERTEAEASTLAIDLADQLYAEIESWRLEDDKKRADDLAKAQAEDARWAALTPTEQQAELDAKLGKKDK